MWIGEIFLPDLFRFCGQKRLLRVWTFFFGQQEQGKNDSFLEGALLSRRRLHENNAYYILHVFVAPGKERTKEIANEKKRTKKKENDHICVHSNGVYDCFVALVKKYYYYYALLLEHQ